MSGRADFHHARPSERTVRRGWVGEVALAGLCERMPGFAGLALWLRHVERPEATSWYACTDGVNVFYGRPFRDIDEREQMSTQAHEVVHAALRHPARLAAVAREYGDGYSAALGNAAADAITNSALGVKQWFKLTDADPTVEAVMAEARTLRRTLGIKAANGRDPCDRTVRDWSLETLYAFMHDLAARAAAEGCLDQAEGPGFGPRRDGRIGGDLIAVEDATPAADGVGGEGARASTLEADVEERVRSWSRRLTGLSAGRDTAGMVRALEGDIPRVRTPWEHHLRDVVGTALTPIAQATWTVPSRRGADAPGWRRAKPAPDLVVIQDTSGSMTSRMLARCAAEIAAIARRRGARITAMSADADVTEIVRPRGDDIGDVLRRLRNMGGGGTDFAPALAAAAALKPDAIVYLTDLCGTFGPDPGRTVVWAAMEANARRAGRPPFGRLVTLH